MSAVERGAGQTLDQQRANHAWQCVELLLSTYEQHEKAMKGYATEAKKLPIRITSSGLGQALAFISAKAQRKKHEEQAAIMQLHRDLSQWVIEERKIPWQPGVPQESAEGRRPEDLLHCVIAGNTDFLRWATDETLTYLEWLNRFLEAKLEFDPTEGD